MTSDMRLSNMVAEQPVNFQTNLTIPSANMAAKSYDWASHLILNFKACYTDYLCASFFSDMESAD